MYLGYLLAIALLINWVAAQRGPGPSPGPAPNPSPSFAPTISPTQIAVVKSNQKGTISVQVVSQNQENNWLISPQNPSASTLQVVFTAISINQAELTICDGASRFSPKLFTCASCGSLIPPPIYSSSGSIFIIIAGVSGISFTSSSFSLQYISLPDSKTPLLANISTIMNMGTATLFPQTYSGLFPALYSQTWTIRATSSLITFYFASFSFPLIGCQATVTVYDSVDASGNIIFSGCLQSHEPKYWFYSKTGKAYVVVTGGLTDTAIYFELVYYFDTEMFNCGSFLMPAQLSGDSMVIVDGTLSTAEMRRSQSCTWLISSATGSSVTLIFDWAQLKFGGSVIVYDGNAATTQTPILWNGQGATKVTPPPIVSTGSNLYVTYASSSLPSSGYLGFRGQYQTNDYGSVGQGRGYSFMSMSSAIDIIPPGNSLDYTPNITYTWYFKPTSVVGSLTFVVSYLDLTSDESLVLYDGPNTTYRVIQNFQPSNIVNVWYKTLRPYATLQFTSKRSTQRKGGFRVSFFGDGSNYHCGFTTNPVWLDAPSMTISDGSFSTDLVYTSQTCQWNISPQKSHGVYLFFTRFYLNSDASVTIYKGPVASGVEYVTISSTRAVPVPILITDSTSVGVQYLSGTRASGTGFAASYFGLSSSFSGTGDGIVWVQCSSMLSLAASRSSYLPMENMTYIVMPAAESQNIFFSPVSFSFLDLNSRVNIYDGTDLNSPLLASFTKNSDFSSFSWIMASSSAALVQFESRSNPVKSLNASFELSFFSDGPNFHCGFHVNPGKHSSASMIFSDGSSSTEAMYPNQYCEWIIQPEVSISSTLSSQFTIVLEFISNDLQGGELHVYDGADSSSTELWSCFGCQDIPSAIISSSTSLFIVFQTYSDSTLGNGFTAVYWTTTTNSWKDSSDAYVLEVPIGYTMDTVNVTLNETEVWSLDVGTTLNTLKYYPTISISSEPLASIADGRKGLSVDSFDYYIASPSICGILQGSGSATIIDKNALRSQRSTQFFDSYLMSQSSAAKSSVVKGTFSLTHSENVFFVPSKVCRYVIDSGNYLAVIINVNRLFMTKKTILRIYGGVFNNDRLLYDSTASVSVTTSADVLAASVQNVTSVSAPCGKAIIVMSYEDSDAAPAFEISYQIDSTDGTNNVYQCNVYKASLLPQEKHVDPYIPLYFAAGAVGFVILLCVVSAYIYRHYGHRDIDCNCIVSTVSRPVYQRLAQPHPRYAPRIDQFLNKFLPKGACCVCQEANVPVMRLSCGHGICVEDIKGYLSSALGNIALFPVKCPMHYESCSGMIGSEIAKRFLTAVQYEKFKEFSDRATYGEGMRCIFCNNYVNFPNEGHRVACVECPYCVQRFCMICKKPWHTGAKCPLDNVDDSLEAWKKDSGAQRCPACHKLIEKDDPDTCNHMVHKITDGIPCIRDRTDFCYLCGEEVLPDYPHNEVRNYGVNHFPEGVFQKCRTILQKEKDAERERLKKAKRTKGKGKSNVSGPGVVNMDAWDDEVVNSALGGTAAAQAALEVTPLATSAVALDPWEAIEGSARNSSSAGVVPPPAGSPSRTRANRASGSNQTNNSPTRQRRSNSGTR